MDKISCKLARELHRQHNQKFKTPKVAFLFFVLGLWFGHATTVALVRQQVDFANKMKQNRYGCPTDEVDEIQLRLATLRVHGAVCVADY